MSKFKFRDNSLKLDINDEIFYVVPEEIYKNKEYMDLAKKNGIS